MSQFKPHFKLQNFLLKLSFASHELNLELQFSEKLQQSSNSGPKSL